MSSISIDLSSYVVIDLHQCKNQFSTRELHSLINNLAQHQDNRFYTNYIHALYYEEGSGFVFANV
uniref:Uncharacterized protein n=1 Tax=Meloidogyne enterolobii TaxID=390850 RepID=A0A6V7X368_MELEN|nr:unnamed protein product [Meloidogyne enterolobii]